MSDVITRKPKHDVPEAARWVTGPRWQCRIGFHRYRWEKATYCRQRATCTDCGRTKERPVY